MAVKPIVASRRNLLLGLGAGVVGLAAVSAPALTIRWFKPKKSKPSLWNRLFFSLQAGTHDEWSRLVGSSFTVQGETAKVAVKLTAVRPFQVKGPAPSDGRTRAFAAIFEGPSLRHVPRGDRSYQFVHDTYGPLEIFVGPRASAGAKGQLIAVFG